jgi:hypothetical protein
LRTGLLRRIFGPRKDEVTGGWRKLHKEELRDLYSSLSIIRIIKSRRVRWTGHVARMGEKRKAYRLLVGKPEGKRRLGRPRRRWVDNIKMDPGEVGCGDAKWTGLAQDVDRWRALVNSMMNLRVPKKMLGNYQVTIQLAASRIVLGSIELFIIIINIIMALQPFSWALATFSLPSSYTQTVRLLGRGISPSQSLYLHTGKHNHRIYTHTDIHGPKGTRTHEPRILIYLRITTANFDR